MKLNPLNDRVVVTPLDAEEKTLGGVILPDTAQEKPNKGQVVAVGPGRLVESTGDRIPVNVQEGQVVFYGKYSGTEVKVNETDFKILREDDILGVEV